MKKHSMLILIFLLSMLQLIDAQVCPGTSISITSPINGNAYQWQVNYGAGFNNIIDNANYTAVNTKTVSINTPPSSWYGYQYRCVVDGNNSNAYTLRFANTWTGAIDTSWENAANWSCKILPDSNSDVIIHNSKVVLNSTPVIKNLDIYSRQYGTPFPGVPDPKDAVIYQVNTRAFSTGGKFQGVTNRLDSIKTLGVNVIYLMPVYPVGKIKTVNSPYCIKNYDSVATEFGTITELRTLIEGAHERGMAVIFDWVANHTSWDNPWINNKSWYQQDGNGNIIPPPNTGWNDVAQLNYNNPEMRLAMINAMKEWIYKVNIDGYRCDAADFIPANFWKQAIDSFRNITTHKLLMFAEGTRPDHYTSGFQLKYGMEFYYKLKDDIFHNNNSVQILNNVNTNEYTNATGTQQVVRYISNHDVNLSDGTPQQIFGDSNGAMASFVVAAYMKGVPMIYNGQEIGYPVRLNYFNNSTPINWVPNPAITEVYKKILTFRNTSEAVKTGSISSYSSNDICAFVKTSGTEKVLVLANLRNATIDYTIPAAINGTTWNNVLTNAQQSFNTQISLAPYTYMILKN